MVAAGWSLMIDAVAIRELYQVRTALDAWRRGCCRAVADRVIDLSAARRRSRALAEGLKLRPDAPGPSLYSGRRCFHTALYRLSGNRAIEIRSRRSGRTQTLHGIVLGRSQGSARWCA